MLKRWMAGMVLCGACAAVSGCAALLVGAGVGGTVFWQGGKVVSEENVSRRQAVAAAEQAFKKQKITITDKLGKKDVTQLRGEDGNKTKVAVDIFEKGAKNARIEIRWGLNEEVPARELLQEIKKRL